MKRSRLATLPVFYWVFYCNNQGKCKMQPTHNNELSRSKEKVGQIHPFCSVYTDTNTEWNSHDDTETQTRVTATLVSGTKATSSVLTAHTLHTLLRLQTQER